MIAKTIKTKHQVEYLITETNNEKDLIFSLLETLRKISKSYNVALSSLRVEQNEQDLIRINFIMESESMLESETKSDEMMLELFELNEIAVESENDTSLERFQCSQRKNKIRPFNSFVLLA